MFWKKAEDRNIFSTITIFLNRREIKGKWLRIRRGIRMRH